MAEVLNDTSVSQLFETVLQHAKCIETRIEFAKAITSQKQKYVLGNVMNKITSAINNICDLLPDSNAVLKIKKRLDDADLVYVMLLTEQLMKIKPDDMEEVVDLLDDYLKNKYDNDQMQSNR